MYNVNGLQVKTIEIYLILSGIGSSVRKSLEEILNEKKLYLYADLFVSVNLYCELYVSALFPPQYYVIPWKSSKNNIYIYNFFL